MANKITLETVKSSGAGIVETTSGKKYASVVDFEQGKQVLCIHNGTSLKHDPRLSETLTTFDITDIVKFQKQKKVSGIALDANRFIEIQAAIAFERFNWSKLDINTRPDFDKQLEGKDFYDVWAKP